MNTTNMLGIVKQNRQKRRRPVGKTIRTLLNSFDQPSVLSTAQNRDIVFLNNAAQKIFGLSHHQLAKIKLHKLFNPHHTIGEGIIWEYGNQRFHVEETPIEIKDENYIQSIIKNVEYRNHHSFDAMDLQQEMAKRLVHRFNSPLNGVTGFTELLKELDLTKKQSKYVNSIEKGVGDFQQILSDIHFLAENIEPQLSSFDIQSFGLDLLNQYTPEKKQRIDLDIASGLTELRSDYILLQSMVTELLENALEFSSNSKKKIIVQFRANKTIRVTNFGPPIPESDTQYMFYPFFTEKARGVGLGLPKCAYYAHALGYNIILATNSAEKGISFDIQM